jgi:hypothetical protein|tara:strand:+ start:1023 stop:1214 length:192 start_codon:yes stop_codon:yes gene_type:complete
MYQIESHRHRRIIMSSDDKENLIKICRDMNEIDKKPLGVNNFIVSSGNEVIYGEGDETVAKGD